MSDPIRLFVGTSANGEDYEAEAVLEYSVRKHCSMPIEITFMRQAKEGPWSGWNCRSWRTPFTGFRWSLPDVCGYQGRAIYTDVDFLFVADLAELWTQPIPDGSVGLVRQPKGKLSTSCILFDCARAKGHVPPLKALRRLEDAHSDVLHYFRTHLGLLAGCAGNWDSPDSTKGPDVKAVHYTRIEHQLHLKHAIPRLKAEGRSHWYTGEIKSHPNDDLVALFDTLLEEAKTAGYTRDRYRVAKFDGATRRDFKYAQGVAS